MSERTKALVTGASGHIGSHIVRAVLAEGWTPVGFVREGGDRRSLRGLDLELRTGDLLDPESLDRALKGVDILFHAGGVHRNHADDPATIVRPTVEGTRNVLAAARKHGVRRVVCTSSAVTVGFAQDPDQPLDESHYLDRPRSVSIRSKVLAERLARAGSAHDTEVVVVNPSGVFGPHDHRLTPTTRALRGLLQGDPAFMHACVTDVRDVAAAHVLAAKKGRVGARYLVTGDNVSPDALATLLHDLAGIRPPRFRPPDLFLKWVGHRAQLRASRDHGDTPFDVRALDDIAGGHAVYDSRSARKELGAQFRPASAVLMDALRWLLHAQALKPAIAAMVRATLGDRSGPDPDWAPEHVQRAA